MISDVARRWAEVQFYYFIQDIYKIRHNTLDLTDMVETICTIAGCNKLLIKKIMFSMLNESSYYKPMKREEVLIGNMIGIKQSYFTKKYNVSRQYISQFIKEHEQTYKAIPRYEPNEDNEIKKFIDTVNLIKKAGI